MQSKEERRIYKREYERKRRKDPKYRLRILEYRRKHYDGIRTRLRESRKKYRLICLIHYGDNPPKCACCGEVHIEFLTIDHINGGGCKHRRKIGGGSSLYNWLIRNNFPDGFRVLCYNCNCSIGHHGYCPHVNEREKNEMLLST